jgi:hypothetical protein
MAGLDAQDAQDHAIEALGGRKVRDGDADVVEHPGYRWPTRAAGRRSTSLGHQSRYRCAQVPVGRTPIASPGDAELAARQS